MSSMAALLASTGLALAQAPSSQPAYLQPSSPAPLGAAVAQGAPGVPPAAAPVGPAPSYLDPASFTHTSLGCGPNGCGNGNGGCSTCGDEGSFCNPCHRVPHRFYGGVEYILWRIKDTGVPVLTTNFGSGFLIVPTTNTFISATTGLASTVTQQVTLPSQFAATAGGGGPNNNKWGDQPGLRFNAGYWFDNEECVGIEASYFHMWKKTNSFYGSAFSPNQDLQTGLNDSQVVTVGASAFGVGGTIISQQTSPVFIGANSETRLLGRISNETWGQEYNARCNLCCFGCMKIDAIGGFRYLDINEAIATSLTLAVTSVPVPTSTGVGALNNGIVLPPSSQFTGVVTDYVGVRNQFFGAQVGLTYDWLIAGKVFFKGFTKLGVGNMHETFNLRGFTQQLIPDAGRPGNPGIATTPGGSLVGPLDNNTRRSFDRICLIPHVNLNLGYELTDNVRFYVGYDYMYITAQARPLNVLSQAPSTTATVIGGSTSPVGATPQTAFNLVNANDDSWIYGINLGFDIRY